MSLSRRSRPVWLVGRGQLLDDRVGQLVQVNLIEPKVVDEVVVEHALPGMTRTAPRRIMVWRTSTNPIATTSSNTVVPKPTPRTSTFETSSPNLSTPRCRRVQERRECTAAAGTL